MILNAKLKVITNNYNEAIKLLEIKASETFDGIATLLVSVSADDNGDQIEWTGTYSSVSGSASEQYQSPNIRPRQHNDPNIPDIARTFNLPSQSPEELRANTDLFKNIKEQFETRTGTFGEPDVGEA